MIAACTGCRDRWIIRVTAMSCRVSRHADNELLGRPPNCGHETGYHDHRRRGEPACDDCKAALAVEHGDRKARRAVELQAVDA